MDKHNFGASALVMAEDVAEGLGMCLGLPGSRVFRKLTQSYTNHVTGMVLTLF